MRIDIDIGTTTSGGSAVVDLEELLATRLLVQGNSGSGKSHLLRRLLEQSAAHVQQLVVDPEGDFVGLAERYGHVVVDGDRSVAELQAIAQRLREHRISAVLTLESLDAENQMRAAAVVLNGLFEAGRDLWFPMLVVVDEAQLFAPAVSGDVGEDTRRLSLSAMTNLMCRGRKRGLAGIIATQRLAKLAKNVAAEATNFLMGRTFLDIDMARAADLLGLDRRQAEMFRDLAQGQFVGLGPAIARRPATIRIGGVETESRAAPPKLVPMPGQASHDARELILAPVPARPARPVAEPPAPRPTTEVLDEIAARCIEDGKPAKPSASALAVEERDGLLRLAAFDMMEEAEAAFRPEPVLYADFQLRCRLLKAGIGAISMDEFKLYLAVGRARVDPRRVDRGAWTRAITVAKAIPDDLQAVYLILAGAALAGTPCPPDAEVARRCGMHSAGRARGRIGHLDRSDRIVVRTDMSGRRIAVLPDLDCETAAGDPDAPAAPIARALAAE